MTTRVALYTRVSTEDQAKEGFSLAAQLERLKFYCASKEDWVVVGEYCDEGKSGRTIKRPDYKRMITDMPKWDVMLVPKMDRIHRSARNFGDMLDFLQKNGKQFVSAAESLDTSTPMGRFFADLLARLAQLESEQTSRRVKEIYESWALTNRWLGPAGYGYQKVAEDGTLTVLEEEAKWIRFIFEQYAAGLGQPAIADALNHLAAPSPHHGNVRGNWHKTGIRQILGNEKFIGHRRGKYEPRDNTHPAIIGQDLWDTVQKRLNRNRELHRRNQYANDQDDPVATGA